MVMVQVGMPGRRAMELQGNEEVLPDIKGRMRPNKSCQITASARSRPRYEGVAQNLVAIMMRPESRKRIGNSEWVKKICSVLGMIRDRKRWKDTALAVPKPLIANRALAVVHRG